MGRKISIGSVERYRISMNVEGLNNSTLGSTEWKLRVWCHSKDLVIDKKSAIRVNDEEYDVFIDTAFIGRGTIKMQLMVDIIDADYKDGLRSQRPIFNTGDEVI